MLNATIAHFRTDQCYPLANNCRVSTSTHASHRTRSADAQQGPITFEIAISATQKWYPSTIMLPVPHNSCLYNMIYHLCLYSRVLGLQAIGQLLTVILRGVNVQCLVEFTIYVMANSTK